MLVLACCWQAGASETDCQGHIPYQWLEQTGQLADRARTDAAVLGCDTLGGDLPLKAVYMLAVHFLYGAAVDLTL